MDDIRLMWHGAGVHTECSPVTTRGTWKHIGDGTHRSCPKAGTVEKFHDHDVPGPLICGCDEFGDDLIAV